MKKRCTILIIVLIIIACIFGVYQSSRKNQYEKAVALMYEEKYDEAAVIFENLGNHLNSQELFEECNTRKIKKDLQGTWVKDEIVEGNQGGGIIIKTPTLIGQTVYKFSGNTVSYSYPKPSFLYCGPDEWSASLFEIVKYTGTFEIKDNEIVISSDDPAMTSPHMSYENGNLELYEITAQYDIERSEYVERMEYFEKDS